MNRNEYLTPSFRACLRTLRLSSPITTPMNFGAPSCFANPGSGGPATPIACPPGLRTVRDFSRFSPPGELDDGRPQAAGAGVDEDLLAGLHGGAVDKGLPGSQ